MQVEDEGRCREREEVQRSDFRRLRRCRGKYSRRLVEVE